MSKENTELCDDSEASLSTVRLVQETQRSHLLPLHSIVSNAKQEASSVITEESITAEVSTLHCSSIRNTMEANPPTVSEDQVVHSEDAPRFECAICLDTSDHTERKTLPCAHIFHEMCVDEWLKTNTECPLCREDIEPDPPEGECPCPWLLGGLDDSMMDRFLVTEFERYMSSCPL